MINFMLIPILMCQLALNPIKWYHPNDEYHSYVLIDKSKIYIKSDRIKYKPILFSHLPMEIYNGTVVNDVEGYLLITGAVDKSGKPLGDIKVDYIAGDIYKPKGGTWVLWKACY